ncbi:MAG: 3'-5' exonuclease [Ruminococcaceae bacterium]|nr:3'-5' exonuclease [Oscillospiraceae bacterium]
METVTKQEKSRDLPFISEQEAARRHLLSADMLQKLHLMPTTAPVARCNAKSGEILYYNPERVKEAPAAHWYGKKEKPKAPAKRPPSGEVRRMSARYAATCGFYSAAALARMYYEPTEGPVAFYMTKSGTRVDLFDRATCRRLPLPCTKCGTGVRYRAKLCEACYRAEMDARRREGDLYRSAKYGASREATLFFDLEMTGVYSHDEVLSVTVMNAAGELLFHSLTRPERKKRWRRTEEIHGITPDMVKESPTLYEIAPELRTILNSAKRLIAFGTSTDLMHLQRLYGTREEKRALREKALDCAAEFARYAHEHELGLTHLSLSDAMTHFGLSWEGTAHSSLADTDACRRVFEQLFPHYYESE